LKLSTTLHYSGDVLTAASEVGALETAGLDCIWIPESYSIDAISMMGYLAGRTKRVEIGSAIVNIYSRTPTLLAMSFAGVDLLSEGRVNCGLGASGPQVIEGFHGIPYTQPVQRMRETIDICRATWRREAVNYQGRAIEIPLPSDRGTGLGKPLKLINHPVRESIPIWWAALKPRSVAATAEVAEGWIPVLFDPEGARKVWGDALTDGSKNRLEGLAPLQILTGGPLKFTDSVDETTKVLDAFRDNVALYVGGMGAKGKNFYNDIMAAYGWEEEAKNVQELYLEGKKKEAAAALPLQFLDAIALVGRLGHIKERISAYKEAGVTHLQMVLSGSLDDKVHAVETMRDLVDAV
jgi:F420-dependent oxidoreductase-like protein